MLHPHEHLSEEASHYRRWQGTSFEDEIEDLATWEHLHHHVRHLSLSPRLPIHKLSICAVVIDLHNVVMIEGTAIVVLILRHILRLLVILLHYFDGSFVVVLVKAQICLSKSALPTLSRYTISI